MRDLKKLAGQSTKEAWLSVIADVAIFVASVVLFVRGQEGARILLEFGTSLSAERLLSASIQIVP